MSNCTLFSVSLFLDSQVHIFYLASSIQISSVYSVSQNATIFMCVHALYIYIYHINGGRMHNREEKLWYKCQGVLVRDIQVSLAPKHDLERREK